MTTESRELSQWSGSPVELYEFTNGATVVRLASSEPSYVLDGNTYTATVMQRSAPKAGGPDAAPTQIDVTLPRDHAVAVWVRDDLTTTPVTCTIRRTHRGESDSVSPAYKFRVIDAQFAGPTCVLTLASLREDFQRNLPLYVTQLTCPLPLYGTLCQAVATDHDANYTVSAIDGVTVTLTGLSTADAIDAALFPEGVPRTPLYVGGWLQTAAGVKVGIKAQDGDDVTLSRPITLSVSEVVTLFAGCDKTVTTCHFRFTNTPHYGGEPVMPARNPFVGSGFE